MQCNLEKFQFGQIEFLTENREGIKATLLIQRNFSSLCHCHPENIFPKKLSLPFTLRASDNKTNPVGGQPPVAESESLKIRCDSRVV